MIKIFFFLTISCFTFLKHNAYGELIRPQKYGTESRFKALTYTPNGIYYLDVHYMNPLYVEFDDDETINTVYSPKADAWSVVNVKNRIFLKPLLDNADTTLTVMTNERTYFFELHTKQPSGPFDPDITFFVKFRYPYKTKSIGQGVGNNDSIIQFVTTKLPDLSKPEDLNFNYTISGDINISPKKVFDNGKSIYIEFKDIIPAIFSVDKNGYEVMVNFKMLGDYVVIEGSHKTLTLRYGSSTVCVFNENIRKL